MEMEVWACPETEDNVHSTRHPVAPFFGFAKATGSPSPLRRTTDSFYVVAATNSPLARPCSMLVSSFEQ